MKKNQLALSSAGLLLLSTGITTTEDGLVAGMFSNGERKKCEFAHSVKNEIGEQNINGEWQGKSAPHLKQGGWITSADFIYWRADEEGLEYVNSFESADQGQHSKNKALKPHIQWDPGFKVGLGYTFGFQDFWDLFFRWTYFNAHQEGSYKGEGTNDLNGDGVIEVGQPWWSPSTSGQFVQNASAHWHLRYNVFDLELGRDYFMSRTIALRPYVGLRGAAIAQNYDVKYTGILVEDNNAPGLLFPSSLKVQNDFGGIGIRAGACLLWHFTSHWAVTGSFSGALLYGHFDIEQQLDGLNNLAEFGATQHQELSLLSPNIEASMGFQWATFFSNNKYRVAITASYEFSEWFSQNQMVNSSIYDNSLNLQRGVAGFNHLKGNLGLQGGTLELRFDF